MENNNISKSKKIILVVVSLLAALALILSLSFVTKNYFNEKDKEEKEEVSEKEQITPLMYEITKEGSNNKIYLFGSMHSVNLNDFDFPKYVMDAYNSSDIVAPEFDVLKILEDSDMLLEYSKSLTYSDGSLLKDHLSENVYNKLINFTKEKGIYQQTYEYFKLDFWESLLSNKLAEDTGLIGDGVDEYFLKKAREDNKEIIDVESFKFQLNLTNSFSDRLYEIMIENCIDNYDKQIDETKKLYKIWKNGDSKELLVLLDNELTEEDLKKLSEEDIKLVKDYNYKLLDERNIGMKDKLIEFFNNDKKVFFMVGAAHLVGEKGIANLLVQEGFTVTQVNK